MTHFDRAVSAWGTTKTAILGFGREAMLTVDLEEKSIRDLSFALCGNGGLEDRIGRWIMAARWVDALYGHPLYEDALEWLTPTHFTELWKIAMLDGTQAALDLMEQCFVRTSTETSEMETSEVRQVDWLRRKRVKDVPSTETLFHRVYMSVTKALPDAYGQLERLGSEATAMDRRRLRVLKLAEKVFSANGHE